MCYTATKSPNKAAGVSTMLPVMNPARTNVPVASLSSTAVFASTRLLPTSAHSSECPSCATSVPFLSAHHFIFSLSSPGAPLEGIRAWSFSLLESRCWPGLSWAQETDPVSPVSWLGIGSCTCRHLRFKGQRGHGLFPVYGRLLFPYQFYLSPSSCPCLSCAPDNFLLCVLWSELDEMPPSPARVVSFSIAQLQIISKTPWVAFCCLGWFSQPDALRSGKTPC